MTKKDMNNWISNFLIWLYDYKNMYGSMEYLPGSICISASSLVLVGPALSITQRYRPASASVVLLMTRAPLGSVKTLWSSSTGSLFCSQRMKDSRSGFTSQFSTWLSPTRTGAASGWLRNRGIPENREIRRVRINTFWFASFIFLLRTTCLK